jgi:hypothetical protein
VAITSVTDESASLCNRKSKIINQKSEIDPGHRAARATGG